MTAVFAVGCVTVGTTMVVVFIVAMLAANRRDDGRGIRIRWDRKRTRGLIDMARKFATSRHKHRLRQRGVSPSGQCPNGHSLRTFTVVRAGPGRERVCLACEKEKTDEGKT